LRKELREATGVDPKIKLGAPGAFDVFVDGRRVFSAQEAGHLPSTEEIVRAVK